MKLLDDIIVEDDLYNKIEQLRLYRLDKNEVIINSLIVGVEAYLEVAQRNLLKKYGSSTEDNTQLKEDTLIDKKNELLRKTFKGIQGERAVKIYPGNASSQEEKMFFMNCYVSVKFLIKKEFKSIGACNVLSNICNKSISELENKSKLDLSNKYKILLKEEQEEMRIHTENIKLAGELLVNILPLCDDLFTDHEIAQIFSCSIKKVKETRKIYDLVKTGEQIQDGFLLTAIRNFVIEDRSDYKGRKRWVKDCPVYEMPFFSSIIVATVDKLSKKSKIV